MCRSEYVRTQKNKFATPILREVNPDAISDGPSFHRWKTLGPSLPQTASAISNRKQDRSAWTLVELAVSLAIISILVSILFIGISSSREMSRKLECSNRLRQLGLGIQMHINATSYLPDGTTMESFEKINIPFEYAMGPIVQALRYSSGFERAFYRTMTVDYFSDPGSHQGLYNQKPPYLLQCPSNSSEIGTTYRANIGPQETAQYIPRPGWYLPEDYPGPFGLRVRTKASEVIRGLSHTAGFSETVPGVSRYRAYNIRFSHREFRPNHTGRAQVWDERCLEASSRKPSARYLGMHGPPIAEKIFDTYYTHRKGPNGTFPLCYAAGEYLDQSGDTGITATSYHSGGVNVCMLDGSIHFYGESVDLKLWKQISMLRPMSPNLESPAPIRVAPTFAAR